MKNMKTYLPKILILASTTYAVVQLLHWPIGFTFFTQLSNIFLAAVVLLQLLMPGWIGMKTLKFSAVVSIFITFLVFLTVLGPVMPGGLIAAYAQDNGASFCLHLLTPLLAFADFFLNDAAYPYGKRHALYAVIPPFVYFIFILVLGQLGFRWGRGSMLAPYPFLDYGSSAGWFGILPASAGIWTTRIGTFYSVLALLVLFYAASKILLFFSGLVRKPEFSARNGE